MIHHVSHFIARYSYYLGVAGMLYLSHTCHILSLYLTINGALAHNVVAIISTAVLAFVGVFAAEAARYVIKRIKYYLNKNTHDRNH